MAAMGLICASMGPLKVHPANPRYFADRCGQAVYLTGSHTHLSFKKSGDRPPGTVLDYSTYLELMTAHNHNFMRLWSAWELNTYSPQPWMMTDGRFDLTKFNDDYFKQLRQRVIAAREKNIYVAVMLFEGWLLRFTKNALKHHPFYGENNINGIDVDGSLPQVHTLGNRRITAIQEAYIAKVVDTVNDLENVLYEVSNESEFPASVQWQYHVIDFLNRYQAKKPKQHPVGMTSAGFSSTYDDLPDLMKSPADWISPGKPTTVAYDYVNNPPPAMGAKVIISDSDHLDVMINDLAWVWKSMMRGVNPIFMDVYAPLDTLETGDATRIRNSMGQARKYATKINLSMMAPRDDLTSTGYALVNPGVEYLIYQPHREDQVSRAFRRILAIDIIPGSLTVNLPPGSYWYEWFNPKTNTALEPQTLTATAGSTRFSPPFAGSAVLHIRSVRQN